MLLDVEIKMIYENGTMGTPNLRIDYDSCGVLCVKTISGQKGQLKGQFQRSKISNDTTL